LPIGRGVNPRALLGADTAEQPGIVPQAHGDEIIDVDRERALDLRRLRQIGDVAAVEPAQVDAAGERRHDADDALEQRRLAGTVGADHREQRAARDHAVEMVHRRVAVIAKRQIVKGQLRHHHPLNPRFNANHILPRLAGEGNRPSQARLRSLRRLGCAGGGGGGAFSSALCPLPHAAHGPPPPFHGGGSVRKM